MRGRKAGSTLLVRTPSILQNSAGHQQLTVRNFRVGQLRFGDSRCGLAFCCSLSAWRLFRPSRGGATAVIILPGLTPTAHAHTRAILIALASAPHIEPIHTPVTPTEATLRTAPIVAMERGLLFEALRATVLDNETATAGSSAARLQRTRSRGGTRVRLTGRGVDVSGLRG